MNNAEVKIMTKYIRTKKRPRRQSPPVRQAEPPKPELTEAQAREIAKLFGDFGEVA